MEALASVILEQFASLEGLSSVYSFNGEVSKLQTTMKNIVAVINEAEERQLKESAVKRWLDQLKEVIYELDDLLDEWNTAITKSIIEDEWNAVIIKSMHEEEAAAENIEKVTLLQSLSFILFPLTCSKILFRFNRVFHHFSSVNNKEIA